MDARVKKRPLAVAVAGSGGGTPGSTVDSNERRSAVGSERGSERTGSSQPAGSSRVKPKKRRLSGVLDTKLCPWENCEVRVSKSDDAMFDHVLKEHITALKGTEARLEEEAKANKMKEEKMEVEEKEDGNYSGSEEEEDDPFSCRWPDCGMSLKRGEEKRKIEWLEEHLHSRHLPAAGRFRCGKCSKFRAKTNKLVADHEKKCGKEEKQKREPRHSPTLYFHPADPRPPPQRKSNHSPVKPADCFQYAHVRAPKKHPLLADFEPAVDAHLQKTLAFKMKHNWNVRRELNPAAKHTDGSQWRKTRLPGEAYRFVVIDKAKEAAEKELAARLKKEARIPYYDLPQTLDDLFPPPAGYPANPSLTMLGSPASERAFRAAEAAVAAPAAAIAAAPNADAPESDASASASSDAYGSVPYSPLSLCTQATSKAQ